MPTESEMLADLDAADKAGDAQLAQHIASRIKVTRSSGPTKAESFLRGGAQGATLGYGDEVQGLAQAAGLKYLPAGMGGGTNAPAPWEKEFWDKNTPGGFFSTEAPKPSATDQRGLLDLYREQRDVARHDDDAARAANPKTFLGGELAGGILPALATSGGAGAAPAAAPGFLRGAMQVAANGAKWGAVTGLGESKADLTQGDVGGAAWDTAKGAATGAAANLALTGVGKAAKKVVNGVVELDPVNTYLRSKGVRDLTLGQAAPKSWFSSIEQAAESLPILDEAIKAQRQAGRASWQKAVLNEARAPGAADIPAGAPAEMLSHAADSFDAAYKPIAALPAQAAVTVPGKFAAPGAKLPLSSAFQEAAADPSVRATDDVRRSVASFLDNAHSELTTTATARPLTAGDLISVRSKIRAEIRSELSGSAPDYSAARLLKNAEDAITGSLHEQLQVPAAQVLGIQGSNHPLQGVTASDLLRETDAQYANLMRVTDAVRRAGDQPGGFTPAQLSAAVKSGTEKNSYAQGGGGELRELASAGRKALDSTVPPTGARLLTLGAGTAALPLTAALAAGATTDVGKRLLTGGTAPQILGRQLIQSIARQRVGLETARRAALVGSTEAANQ